MLWKKVFFYNVEKESKDMPYNTMLTNYIFLPWLSIVRISVQLIYIYLNCYFSLNHWKETLINTEQNQSQLFFYYLNTWLLEKIKIHTPSSTALNKKALFLTVSPCGHSGCNCSELWWNERKRFCLYISAVHWLRVCLPLIWCESKVRLIRLQRGNLIHLRQANTIIYPRSFQSLVFTSHQEEIIQMLCNLL